MELWSCSVVSGSLKLATILVGIFSNKEKAKVQAHIFMQGVGDLFEQVDHGYEGDSDEVLYYQTKHTNEKFTFYIEGYILDKLSY